jgi:hypothetical protein
MGTLGLALILSMHVALILVCKGSTQSLTHTSLYLTDTSLYASSPYIEHARGAYTSI